MSDIERGSLLAVHKRTSCNSSLPLLTSMKIFNFFLRKGKLDCTMLNILSFEIMDSQLQSHR